MFTSLMPLADDNEGRILTPYVTYTLLALNIIVFIFLQLPNPYFTYSFSVIPYEITSGHDLTRAVRTSYGVIPQAPGPQPIYLTLFSAMFMHGGWAHLGGNMLYLWIFGDNVEDALGHAKFLIFYVLCGLAASFAQIFFEPSSVIPSLGASGAIAGVLGGYLVMFPSRSVRVLVGWFGIVALPAMVVIGFWIVLQFMNGLGSVVAKSEQTGGVAYWAHIGGAVAGLLLVSLFRDKRARARAQQRMGHPARGGFFDAYPRQ